VIQQEAEMRWETPTFEDIDMNAEIGGYQGDSDDRGGGAPPRSTGAAREEVTTPGGDPGASE
jgi:hypothetical protein